MGFLLLLFEHLLSYSNVIAERNDRDGHESFELLSTDSEKVSISIIFKCSCVFSSFTDVLQEKLQDFLSKLLDVTAEACPVKTPALKRDSRTRDLYKEYAEAMSLIGENYAEPLGQ